MSSGVSGFQGVLVFWGLWFGVRVDFMQDFRVFNRFVFKGLV